MLHFYVECLRSKWIYPSNIEDNRRKSLVFTLPWDLYSKSMEIHLFVKEEDPSQTIETTRTVTSEFASKSDFSFNLEEKNEKINWGAKLGYGFSKTLTQTSSTKVLTKIDSDDLGTLSFYFYDPIIRKELNGTYELYNVFNGSVEATLIPVDSSK